MTAPRLCECGCGQPTNPAPKTCRRKGWVAGEPLRFIRGHAGGLATAQGARARPPADPPRTQTERYLEKLLHRSKLIVGALRFDPGDLQRQIDLALAMRQPDGVDPAVALVTVLAAQIDPDTTDEQRLGWVRAFDREAAQAPTPPRQLPVVRASPRKETAA